MVNNPLKYSKGEKFGNWTLHAPGAPGRRWWAHCKCGNLRPICVSDVKRGTHNTCGCGRRDEGSTRYSHGHSGTKAYPRWQRLRGSDMAYRGIKNSFFRNKNPVPVHKPWFDDFMTFAEDTGAIARMKNGETLIRIDATKPWEPGNVRWVKRKSRRPGLNFKIKFRGRTAKLRRWSEVSGLTVETLAGRLSRGWDIESSLTTPSYKTPEPFKDNPHYLTQA